MDLKAQIQEAIDRLKNAHTSQEVQKAVAIAEMVKLLAQEQNDAPTNE